ncbi:hypothetical protein B0T21DRAFT_346754 [Apiosordaria backusii]|uniref:Uncharacterized protein n=1 Tax=Apiosordaria backusii TaxID=314023 RepID=A0AA40BS68_9PEZI|nr:hypothetical protein B0T21DRAFT_346754 [Apiosordaria backusii]
MAQKSNKVSKPAPKPKANDRPSKPTSVLSHLTPEQQAEIITRRFEEAPATGVIPPGYKPPTYDPKYDLPEYSFDALLTKFHGQTQESYVMEAEIRAENEARRIPGEPPCQTIPPGYKPPTYDPKYNLPEYSFEDPLAKFHRPTQEPYVMEDEIREEQRARLLRAKQQYQATKAQQAAQEAAQQQSVTQYTAKDQSPNQAANRQFPIPPVEQQQPSQAKQS